MKQGRTLSSLAAEIERQAKSKKDFLAPSHAITMFADAHSYHQGVDMELAGMPGKFRIGAVAHEQIAGKLGIPKRYYDTMLERAPYLLAENVNHWLHSGDAEERPRRMIRTLDRWVRAFLSDKYRPLDNCDLTEAVLPSVLAQECRVESCEVTERRLYIKAVSERVTALVGVGDIVQAGVIVSNSEVGCGSVRVEPMVFRLSCLNGAIMADTSLKKHHIGRGFGTDEGVAALELYKDETREADDKAFFMKVRDVVEGTLDKVRFDTIVDKFRDSTERRISGSVEGSVEEVTDKFSLNEAERDGLLRFLIEGGELSQYGMMNALSRASHEVDDYDRATELERNSGQIIELPAQDWARIATK